MRTITPEAQKRIETKMWDLINEERKLHGDVAAMDAIRHLAHACLILTNKMNGPEFATFLAERAIQLTDVNLA